MDYPILCLVIFKANRLLSLHIAQISCECINVATMVLSVKQKKRWTRQAWKLYGDYHFFFNKGHLIVDRPAWNFLVDRQFPTLCSASACYHCLMQKIVQMES